MIRRSLRLLILIWHRFIAPMFGPCCRFYPSCSVYALDVLDRQPLTRAFALIGWRLVRCQPLHPGGYDPAPGVDPEEDAARAARRRLCCRHHTPAADSLEVRS